MHVDYLAAILACWPDEYVIEILQVIEYTPTATTGLNPSSPVFNPLVIFPRINIVTSQFRDIESNHLSTIHLDGEVADVSFDQLLLEVGEYEDILLSGAALGQVFH